MTHRCHYEHPNGLRCQRKVREHGERCPTHYEHAAPAPGLLGAALRVLRDPETGEPREVR